MTFDCCWGFLPGQLLAFTLNVVQVDLPQIHPVARTREDKLDIVVVITIAFILHILFLHRPVLRSLLYYRRGGIDTICR